MIQRLMLILILITLPWLAAADQRDTIPGPIMTTKQIELATLGGGCFWCIEAILKRLRGVSKVTSGYSGGSVENPTYEQVTSGRTGHAEVVQVEFDPGTISFSTLLEVFFHLHDPTTKDRQGNDVGPQYRSVVFYHNEQQRAETERAIKRLSEAKLWAAPFVTEVTQFGKFYSAEQYHQDYFDRNQNQPYCSLVIAPKIRKLLKDYAPLLKDGVAKSE